MYQRDDANGINEVKLIDLRLSFLKPQGFKWLVKACSHVEKLNCIQNEFREVGITEALANLV